MEGYYLMRLKKLLSVFVSGVIAVTAFNSLSFTSVSAEDDYILVSEPVQADKDWGQALTLQGSHLDKDMLKEGCTVYVEYEGDDNIELVCQSWPDDSIEGCDKEIWAKISPTTDENGIATFTYDDIYNAFIVDFDTTWDCLMAFHISVTSKDTIVNYAYISYEDSSSSNPAPEDENSENESSENESSENESSENESSEEQSNSDDDSSDANSSSSAPTISFDMDNWSNYLHLTEGASTAGIKLSTTRQAQYQGATLQVSVNMASDLPAGTYPTYASTVRDEDGNPAYPDAANEDSTLVNPGFELYASDFGLETFDGATVTFKYAFNEDVADVLLEGSMFMYARNDEGEILVNFPMKATINTITKENINYDSNGFVTVPSDVDATKLVFEIPLIKAYKGTVLMMDNLTIEINGEKIANVDGFNDTAEPMNESDGVLKITGEGASSSDSSQAESKDDGSSFNPIILVVILFVIAAVVLVVVIIIKNKNRYY